MVNVACVGAGYWGKNLVRNLHGLAGCRLKYVCDADKETCRRMASQYPDVAVAADLEDVLRDPELDAVVIAVPVPSHYAVAKRAIECGKHTYVEKPLTLSTQEAERLVELAEGKGLTLMVGHLLEYHPAVERIKAIVDSGEIGDIRYVYSQRLNLGIVRENENAFWSLAPHDISVMLYLMNAPRPLRVHAVGRAYLRPGIEDVVFVAVEFADNRMGHVHVSWLDPHKTRRITVVGSKKMAVFDDMETSEKIRIYDKGAEAVLNEAYANSITLHDGDITIPRVGMSEPLKLECQHFVDCVRTGARPRSDGRDGLRVVQILEAAERSLRNGGGPVEVAPSALV
jgi:predicted dehydrogenase